MNKSEIENLTLLINIATDARPKLDAEVFILNHWKPFVNSLSLQDRRMAWQLFLKAQANHIHAIAEHLQTLSSSKIKTLTPVLEKFVSIDSSVRNWGEKPISA